jgi:hypothetical protein
MGKSTLQYNLAMLNVIAERGVAVIDPHGDLAEAIADSIPRRRDQPVGFNPLANVALAATGTVSAFKHL